MFEERPVRKSFVAYSAVHFFRIFLVGISIPGRNTALHLIVVVISVAPGFVFYALTFHKVLNLKSERKIFWIVAVIVYR